MAKTTKGAAAPEKKRPEFRVKTFSGPVVKQDESALRSRVAEVDDEFENFYSEALGQMRAIRPPFDLKQLANLIQQNNALGPCVDAMEVNIDGTGHSVEPVDEGGVADTGPLAEKKARIEDFFDQVWPGVSLVTLRRRLRRDLESTGMGYIEVIRNLDGEVVFLRHGRSTSFRLVRLDDPVVAEKTVRRGGEVQTFSVWVRERRFMQRAGSNRAIYFKEFGASRDLDKNTGRWAEEDERIPFEDRATELIFFTVHDDVDTPYGIPRWIAQTPSVLGSRKAEEFNLTFFDAGGIPPVIIFLAGGRLAERTEEALNNLLSGRAQDKHKSAVVEVEPTGGTLEKEPPTRVTVERFGSDQMQDSMFEKYDERSELRVRRAFRLPPIFVGMSQDYSFATAFASYTVAEAQIFKSERMEFDEIINATLMMELDPEGDFKFVSSPLMLADSKVQQEGLRLAWDAAAIDEEQLVEAINDITDLALTVRADIDEDEEEEEEDEGGVVVPFQDPAQAGAQPGAPPAPAGSAPAPVARAEKQSRYSGGRGTRGRRGRRRRGEEIVELARRANAAVRRRGDGQTEELVSLARAVDELSPEDRTTFESMLSVLQFEDVARDPDGLRQIAGCAFEVIASRASRAA